jgi:hypothetical protein
MSFMKVFFLWHARFSTLREHRGSDGDRKKRQRLGGQQLTINQHQQQWKRRSWRRQRQVTVVMANAAAVATAETLTLRAVETEVVAVVERGVSLA